MICPETSNSRTNFGDSCRGDRRPVQVAVDGVGFWRCLAPDLLPPVPGLPQGGP